MHLSKLLSEIKKLFSVKNKLYVIKKDGSYFCYQDSRVTRLDNPRFYGLKNKYYILKIKLLVDFDSSYTDFYIERSRNSLIVKAVSVKYSLHGLTYAESKVCIIRVVNIPKILIPRKFKLW